MSYLVLARKYRPQVFTDLVGQEHVAQTLENAFKLNKLHHAYLFTGTRGVGKTSAARIFAKTLRCEGKKKNPAIACGKCQSCLEMNEGGSMDVLEIDGASNNGVENVREIRDSVQYMPSHGSRKIYIIDEVHMLTTAAFNALLKTLEEPPEHVTFILATTEVQKIPATILSRCQRFDFKRAPIQKIHNLLTSICQKENITAEDTVLTMVARKADGSLRDALSLLDQAIALCGTNLKGSEVSDALSIVDRILLAEMLQNTFSAKVADTLQSVQKLFNTGINMKTLTVDLLETVRQFTFIKLNVTSDELGREEQKFVEQAVENISAESLQAAFRILTETVEEVTRSPLPKATLEMALIRISQLGDLASVSKLLQRSEQLARAGVTVSSSGSPTGMAPQGMQAQRNAGSFAGPGVTSRPAFSTAGMPAGAPAEKKTFGQGNRTADAPKAINWEGFVQHATAAKPMLGALLEHAFLLTSISEWRDKAVVEIGFRKEQSFYFEQCQLPMKRKMLEELLSGFLGKPKQLNVRQLGAENGPVSDRVEPKPVNTSIAEKSRIQTQAQKEKDRQVALDDPVVKATRNILGARLLSAQKR